MAKQPVPHARVLRARTDATTHTLVADVTEAARTAAAFQKWPRGLDRNNALEYVHALAASIVYKEDHADQVIKMPGALLECMQGDCKSTAVLCAALLSAAGHKVYLKFLQYERGREHYAHVYCVADDTPVDPLLPLGEEFTYFRAIQTRIR